jgi:hypothetical protein
VLLSQNEPVAEVFARSNDKWIYERLTNDAKLKFTSLELEVVLSDLYKNLPDAEAEES